MSEGVGAPAGDLGPLGGGEEKGGVGVVVEDVSQGRKRGVEAAAGAAAAKGKLGGAGVPEARERRPGSARRSTRASDGPETERNEAP